MSEKKKVGCPAFCGARAPTVVEDMWHIKSARSALAVYYPYARVAPSTCPVDVCCVFFSPERVASEISERRAHIVS
jgi:hypothetical protein